MLVKSLSRYPVRLALAIVLLSGLCRIEAQDLPAKSGGTTPSFVAPQPIGGMETLARNIIYPEAAKKEGIEGKVMIEVAFGADGSLTKTTVKTGVRDDLDKAALNAISAIKWSPASVDGVPTAVTILIPIEFKLDSKKKID
jgi:TonB family protein